MSVLPLPACAHRVWALRRKHTCLKKLDVLDLSDKSRRVPRACVGFGLEGLSRSRRRESSAGRLSVFDTSSLKAAAMNLSNALALGTPFEKRLGLGLGGQVKVRVRARVRATPRVRVRVNLRREECPASVFWCTDSGCSVRR